MQDPAEPVQAEVAGHNLSRRNILEYAVAGVAATSLAGSGGPPSRHSAARFPGYGEVSAQLAALMDKSGIQVSGLQLALDDAGAGSPAGTRPGMSRCWASRLR